MLAVWHNMHVMPNSQVSLESVDSSYRLPREIPIRGINITTTKIKLNNSVTIVAVDVTAVGVPIVGAAIVGAAIVGAAIVVIMIIVSAVAIALVTSLECPLNALFTSAF